MRATGIAYGFAPVCTRHEAGRADITQDIGWLSNIEFRDATMKWTTPLRTQAVLAPLGGKTTDERFRSDDVSIICHKNGIPPYVKHEMEKLYQNSFSSTAAEHVDPSSTHTYIACNSAGSIAIFLFNLEKKRVKVLNGAIRLSAEEIARFSKYIFREYPSVRAIGFERIQTEIVVFPFPYQQLNTSEDIVLTLPASAEQYLRSLGKSTRKYIKYHLNRQKRFFPTCCYEVYDGQRISEELVQTIIDLNTARMANKNKASTIDQEQRNWIVKIAKTYGFVGVTKIDGKVCAGIICSRIGGNYFMHVIAHDPQYDDYRLGMLCCYMTICEAIARGGKEYHFLWGQGEYKYRLLGVQRNLDDVLIFRTRTAYMLGLKQVWRNNVVSHIRQSKIRLEKNANAHTFSSRLTSLLLGSVHALKRLNCLMAGAIKKYTPFATRRR